MVVLLACLLGVDGLAKGVNTRVDSWHGESACLIIIGLTHQGKECWLRYSGRYGLTVWHGYILVENGEIKVLPQNILLSNNAFLSLFDIASGIWCSTKGMRANVITEDQRD